MPNTNVEHLDLHRKQSDIDKLRLELSENIKEFQFRFEALLKQSHSELFDSMALIKQNIQSQAQLFNDQSLLIESKILLIKQDVLSLRSSMVEESKVILDIKKHSQKSTRVQFKKRKRQIDQILKQLTSFEDNNRQTLMKNVDRWQSLIDQTQSNMTAQFDSLNKKQEQFVQQSASDIKLYTHEKSEQNMEAFKSSLASMMTQLNQNHQDLKNNIEQTSVKTLSTITQDMTQIENLFSHQEKSYFKKLDESQAFILRSNETQKSMIQTMEQSDTQKHEQLKQLSGQQNQQWVQSLIDLKQAHEKQNMDLKEQLIKNTMDNIATYKILEEKLERLKYDIKEQTGDGFLKMHHDLSQTLKSNIQSQNDDLASLMVANKGQWQDVIDSAKKGSLEAGHNIKNVLQNEFVKDLESLSIAQAKGFKDVLLEARNKINKHIYQHLSVWPLRILILLLLTQLLVSVFTFWHINRKSSDEVSETANTKIDTSMVSIAPQAKQMESIESKKSNTSTGVFFIERGDQNKKEYSITLDGGSDSTYTAETLSILRNLKINTTVFLTGEFILKFPTLTRTIVRDGHEVGNHLYFHDHLIDSKSKKSLYSKEDLLESLQKVETLFLQTTGIEMTKLWRAPYGEFNQEQIKWAGQNGFTHVDWTRSQGRNLDTLDWVNDQNHKLYLNPSQIFEKIMGFEENDAHGLNGGIILMHLSSQRNQGEQAITILPDLVTLLDKKGYQHVKTTQLIKK